MAETEASWASCGESTPRDQRNSVRILGASLAWAGSLIGVALLLTQDLPGPIAWLVAPIPTVAGIRVPSRSTCALPFTLFSWPASPANANPAQQARSIVASQRVVSAVRLVGIVCLRFEWYQIVGI